MTQVCFKCMKSNGSILSRNGASKLYCADCFSEFCVKTLKNGLFVHCGLPSSEPIAVGVSGGYNSMFLLYQLGVLRVMGTVRGGEGRTEFVFLPFHLCEEELVCPFPSSRSSISSCSGSSNAGAPVEELPQRTSLGIRSVVDSAPEFSSLRAKRQHSFQEYLKEHFQLIQKTILEQLEKWEWASQPLFSQDHDEQSLKVFRFSDFFSKDQMDFLHAVLHDSSMSHDCREELYYRVREGALRAAAHRLSEEWKTRNAGGSPKDVLDIPASTPMNASSLSQWVHYMSGENAVRCCVSALHSVVTGGGGCSLLQHAGFCSFFHHVRQMRPLRMLLSNEIVFFNRLHHIEAFYTPTLSTGISFSSVRRVLEGFTYEMMATHRTILFNVLTVVSHLDPKRLFPVSSGSLEGENGVDLKKKKHMVFSKVASRHKYLSMSKPPQLQYTWDSPSITSLQEKMCFMCGCPIHSEAVVSISETKEVPTYLTGQTETTAKAEDGEELCTESGLVCCIPCRECINSTFYCRKGATTWSSSSWIEICRTFLES